MGQNPRKINEKRPAEAGGVTNRQTVRATLAAVIPSILEAVQQTATFGARRVRRR